MNATNPATKPRIVPPEEVPGHIFDKFGSKPLDYEWDFGGISRRGAYLKDCPEAVMVYDIYYSFESHGGEKDFRVMVFPSEADARAVRNCACSLEAKLVPFGGNIIVMSRGGLKRRVVSIEQKHGETLYDANGNSSARRLLGVIDEIAAEARRLIGEYLAHLRAQYAA